MTTTMQRLQPSPRLLILPFIITLLIVYHVYSRRVELASTHLRSPPHATPYRTLNGSVLPPVAPRQDLPGIHLFMPMDEKSSRKNLRFCRAVESAVVNGWEVHVFNWEAEDINFLRAKVSGLARLMDSPLHTKDIAEDDLVFMIDASDVWLQLSSTVMARRFLEYDSEVLVSTQKTCWPNAKNSETCLQAPQSLLPAGLYNDQDDESNLSIYRPAGLRPQYANSGSIIGRLKSMRPLYASLMDVLTAQNYTFDGDQGSFNVLLGRHKLRLDYWSRLFWAADEDLPNIHFMNTRYPPDPTTYDDDTTPWELYPALAHHSKTGEVPVAVHLNGPKKQRSRIEEMWGYHWWNSDRARFSDIVKSRMDRGVVRIATEEGYTRVSVREICPMLDVWDEQPPVDGLYYA